MNVDWADPLNSEANACNHDASMGMVPAPGVDCSRNYGEEVIPPTTPTPFPPGGKFTAAPIPATLRRVCGSP